MRAVGRYGGRAVRIAAIGAFCTALPPSRLTAQSSPTVRSAIQLAAAGRGDSARHLLDGELTRTRGTDSLYVEALYWRARLAPGGENASRDLRRIVVEYGNSPWADDALLQLSQLALAGGNPGGALEYAARLRSDYPGSDLRPRAAFWGARASFDVGETRGACALLDSARTEGAADIEFVNQVAFYRGRCTATALAAPPARLVPDSSAAPSVTSVTFEVQVLATSNVRTARDVVRRLAARGHQARILAGERGLQRVRLGPFATRDAADSAAAAARRVVGGSPFVIRLP